MSLPELVLQPEGNPEWNKPLDPAELHRMHVIEKPQATTSDFDPTGTWSSSYRIWGNYGFFERLNREIGFVHLKRERIDASSCVMTVHQEIYDLTGIVNRIRVRMLCRSVDSQDIITPVSWKLSSEIVSATHQVDKRTSFEEEGRIENKLMELQSQGRKIQREIGSPLTCNWGVIETVQRQDFTKNVSLSFHLLEEMLTLKGSHSLHYGGEYSSLSSWDRLHWFYQLGEANLPYDFYVDSNHRVQLIISMNRVYILDARAQEKAVAANNEYLQKHSNRN